MLTTADRFTLLLGLGLYIGGWGVALQLYGLRLLPWVLILHGAAILYILLRRGER